MYAPFHTSYWHCWCLQWKNKQRQSSSEWLRTPQTWERSHPGSRGSLALRRHGKKSCVTGISVPGTGPSLQEPQTGRSAKDFDICCSKVPQERKHLPSMGCEHPPGSTRSPGAGAGDREEKGEFLKDDFLKHLISTDFLHLKLLLKCAYR